jgi:RNA polymerase sigma factor (sigma-70 family)
VSGFPATRYSVVREAASSDPEARRRGFEALAAAYWKPVYKYLRLKWHVTREDAEDLTQGFFARALEKAFFDGYDPTRGRFRTWLRVCLDGFAANERKSARRQRRGGGELALSLDFAAAEGELRLAVATESGGPEECFRREWVRALFADAVVALRERAHAAGKSTALCLFERYDLEGPDSAAKPTYASLAHELGLPVTQVTNHLAWARREFRRLALGQLARQCASDDEFRAEARDLFGVHPGRSATPHPLLPHLDGGKG